MKVVILDSLFDDLDVEREVAATYAADVERWDTTAGALASADVAMHVRTRVDARLIEGLSRCRVIGRFGTGLDSVDLAAADAAGIEVVGVRDYCLPELPTHTLALGFALVRRVGELAAEQVASWDAVAAERPLRRRPRALVVGLGSVGSRVAAALVALGYAVTARSASADTRPRPRSASTSPRSTTRSRGRDIVFLHCALDERTRGLIDARRLALLPSGALLVNTARLGLLDEHAVAAALADGRLGGLGLDAQLGAESPLRRFLGDPRVLVTPHVGWYSVESASELRRKAMAAALEARPLSDRRRRTRDRQQCAAGGVRHRGRVGHRSGDGRVPARQRLDGGRGRPARGRRGARLRRHVGRAGAARRHALRRRSTGRSTPWSTPPGSARRCPSSRRATTSGCARWTST